MKDKRELVEAIRGVLETYPRVLFAFLFGSWVRGNVRVASDVDVAIYLASGTPGLVEIEEENCHPEVWEIWDRLEEAIGKDVDLVVLNRASPLVAWEALQGEPLLIRDMECYLSYLFLVYDRAQELEEIMREAWRKGEVVRSG